jgi:hypothetical protein
VASYRVVLTSTAEKELIGTIFSPVRFGSTPEITWYELKRG